MCTRRRTDVDPPRVELPSTGGISFLSPPPEATACYLVATSRTSVGRRLYLLEEALRLAEDVLELGEVEKVAFQRLSVRVDLLHLVLQLLKRRLTQIRCDTRCYFNVRSKADTSQLTVPHGTNN